MVSPREPVAPPVLKEPKQSRSRLSFEKILTASRALLIEKGFDAVTLADVVNASGLSLGSIYGRVYSKYDLLRLVQVHAYDEISRESDVLYSLDRWKGLPLTLVLRELLDGTAELLRRHAPVLRPFMLRGATDEAVRTVGRAAAMRAERQFEDVLLLARDDIKHRNPERAVHACYTTAYSCYARYLGLGNPEIAEEGDWAMLKDDVLLTCASLLLFGDAAYQAVTTGQDPLWLAVRSRR